MGNPYIYGGCQHVLMVAEIIPYKAQYAGHFRDLNLAWLTTYFEVEEKDRMLLENCQEHILDPGGRIFFATLQDEIVGCFALIKLKEGVFELGKMAVDPCYQGMKIGQMLLEFAIGFAREQQWKKIVLYSSSKLPAALHIYRKFGFVEVNLQKNNPYKRSDIKMELVLNTK